MNSIDHLPPQSEIEAVSANPFDMGRVRGLIGELDPENKLNLIQDTASIAKLFAAFGGGESPADAVTNVVKIMNADRTATVDSILEDLARKKEQR